MRKHKFLALTVLLLCRSAFAFDYSAYPLRQVDDVVDQGRAIDKERKSGVKVMTPPIKLSFDVRLESLPTKCKTDFLHRVMQMQGFNPEQLPQINTCVRVSSARGEQITAYIQDAVAEFIGKEAKVGQQLRFYAIYVYFSQEAQLPFFLASEFQVPK